MRLLYLLCILLLIILPTKAQDIFQLTSAKGLPSNFINDIAIDHQTLYKWIGTEGGLSILDHNNNPLDFVEVNKWLLNTPINRIKITDNAIWIGTYRKGVFRLKSFGDIIKVDHFPFPKDENFSLVTDIIRYNGKTYVATNGGGIYIVKGKHLLRKYSNFQKPKLLSNNITFFSKIGKDLWIGTESGLAILRNGKIHQFKKFQQVTCISKYINNSILVATIGSNGINCYKIAKGASPNEVEPLKIKVMAQFLRNSHYKKLLYQNKKLWLLSQYLSCLENGNWSIFKNDKLKSRALTSFAIENPCYVWLGTEDNGVFRINTCSFKNRKNTYEVENDPFIYARKNHSINLNLLFDHKSATLKESENLLNLLSFLKEHSHAKIDIYGHTLPNLRGSNPDARRVNYEHMQLSTKRAHSVKYYLINKGVHTNQIQRVKGYGGNKPLKNTPLDSELHQRVEVKIVELGGK